MDNEEKYEALRRFQSEIVQRFKCGESVFSLARGFSCHTFIIERSIREWMVAHSIEDEGG